MGEHTSYKVGILGAGFIADYHARAIKAVPGAALVAVCDVKFGQAERFVAGLAGARAYASLDAMLAGDELDVVHVLLPPERHLEAGLRVLERGVHVLFEKPLCTTEADCRRLIEAASRSGKKVGTSHNFLFAKAYERLREAVRDGRLGRVDEIEIVWNKFLPQAKFGPYSAWMLREPQNIMLEVGPHSMAHLLDLVGDVDSLRVDVGRPLDLPGGRRFYQRWDVRAEAGQARAHLRYSLIDGYTEHRVHVRGTLASATADFERDLFQLQHHRPLGVDFDRFAAITSESVGAVVQGTGTLMRYVLTKAKLHDHGAPFQAGILRSVKSFYSSLGSELDERHAPEFAARVVALGERIGREAPIETPSAPPVTAVTPTPNPEVVVTGATGFIGRELVRQLVAQGRGVRIVTRSAGAMPSSLEGLPIDVAAGSLSDPAFLARAVEGTRAVVHLARSHGTTWKEYEVGDVEVTRKLAQACLDAKVQRFVYSSSIVIYYTGAAAGVITEDTPPDPAVMESQAYAKSKVVSERMLEEMHRKDRLPLVIVRPGIVLGPGGNPCHWGVGAWPHNSVCEVWGSGKTELPVVLVQDVADGIVRCIDTAGVEGQSFNFVGDAKLTAHQYLDEIERTAGIRLERHTGSTAAVYATELAKYAVKVAARYPEPTRPSYRAADARTNAAHFDCTRAKQLLGWQPTADSRRLVEEGVRKPVAEFML